MPDRLSELSGLARELVGDAAGEWDLAGRIPEELVRGLGAKGVLCAQVPVEFGGPALTSAQNGELTASVGRLCSSLRSLMTSHGMAAWVVQRFGGPEQCETYLRRLTSGALAAVAFSEPTAGSDLSAMRTTVTVDGDLVRVDGAKIWVTGAAYADLIAVFGRHGEGAAVVLVPTDSPGVTVRRVPSPMGCRAAGHADVTLDGVTLPREALLGGAGLPIDWLVTSALSYGRLSVAWGCVGILRACLAATVRHTRERRQFGKPLVEHQLVARQLAEMLVAEQAAALACGRASSCWDENAPELVAAAVVAKHLAAGSATEGARAAVQLLGSAGAQDGHPVARAYRDAKLMEIIEGSNEICQLLLADQAVQAWS